MRHEGLALVGPAPRLVHQRPSIVVLEDTAQSFSTLDAAVNVEFVPAILGQLVLETLVVTLEVIVLRVLLHGRPKVALAEWDDLGQTLGLDGTNEPLRVVCQNSADRKSE